MNRLRLKPFTFDKDFRSFLKAVDEELPFEKRSNLSDPHMAEKLYYASRGNLRVLMKLFEIATYEAVATSRNQLTEDDFYIAFNAIRLSSRPLTVNPFNDASFNYKKSIAIEKMKKDDK